MINSNGLIIKLTSSAHNNYLMAYSRIIDPRVYPQDLSCVLQGEGDKGGIWIGNLEASQNLQTLKKHRIKSVLTSCTGVFLCHPKSEVPYYLYIPGQDYQAFDLSRYFNQAAAFINDSLQKTNILVHCMAGISRSVSLVLAYLIKHRQMTYEQAYSAVKSKRDIIRPNKGFVSQLKKYQGNIKLTWIKSQTSSNQASLILTPSMNRSAYYQRQANSRYSIKDYSKNNIQTVGSKQIPYSRGRLGGSCLISKQLQKKHISKQLQHKKGKKRVSFNLNPQYHEFEVSNERLATEQSLKPKVPTQLKYNSRYAEQSKYQKGSYVGKNYDNYNMSELDRKIQAIADKYQKHIHQKKDVLCNKYSLDNYQPRFESKYDCKNYKMDSYTSTYSKLCDKASPNSDCKQNKRQSYDYHFTENLIVDRFAERKSREGNVGSIRRNLSKNIDSYNYTLN